MRRDLLEQLLVRGRQDLGWIHAVYEGEDGGLETVDFKTGRYFEKSDSGDQLELYAEALKANGLSATDEHMITLTYCVLRGRAAARDVSFGLGWAEAAKLE
ncbi:MAG: PD-(D/E)XK nuclease family protein [Actinomycetota bacterium]